MLFLLLHGSSAMAAQIGLIEFANIVVEQGNGDDQRNICEAIGLDHLQHFLFFIR